MLKAFHSEGILEAGCDEAGRGCLAGPVYAAAVILPPEFSHPLLNDSKKLKVRTREILRDVIESEALYFSVAFADVEEIDQINILNASILAMHRAVEKLSQKPECLLVDGNRFKPMEDIPHACIVRGDGIYASIAAASILAKTYRDEHMGMLHKQYPSYAWKKNKGYPTREHRRAILEAGACEHHRRSFKLLDDQMTLSFS